MIATLLSTYQCIIWQLRADIDEDTARQVRASNLAVAASNFCGPNLHQYWSVAINLSAKMEIITMWTIISTINKYQGKEGENCGTI